MRSLKLNSLLFFVILFLSGSVASAQRPTRPKPTPTPPLMTVDAVTADGKRVVLKSDGTWQYSTEQPAEPISAQAKAFALKLQAALIFQNGDVVPAARTEFRLYSEDIAPLIDTDDMRLSFVNESRSPSLKDSFKTARFGELVSTALKYAIIYPSSSAKVAQILKSKPYETVVTDFQGGASISLKPGTYYLFGAAEARKGFGVWYEKIVIESQDVSIVLDNRNQQQ